MLRSCTKNLSLFQRHQRRQTKQQQQRSLQQFSSSSSTSKRLIQYQWRKLNRRYVNNNNKTRQTSSSPSSSPSSSLLSYACHVNRHHQQQQHMLRLYSNTIANRSTLQHRCGRPTKTSSYTSTRRGSRMKNFSTARSILEETIPEPTFRDLQLVALGQAIPFIGFGFMDNAILIIAGDVIDTKLGVLLGISTLCAAAIGNIISDLAGIALGTVIEDFCANVLRLPTPNLTSAQRTLRSVRFAGQWGMAVGMTVGCVLGMVPLLWIDSEKIARLKQRANLEALFQDVVTEAKTLIGAESTCLYLRVEKHSNDDSNEKTKQEKNKNSIISSTSDEDNTILPYHPSAEGQYLYAMYYDAPSKTKQHGLVNRGTKGLPPTSNNIVNNNDITTATTTTSQSGTATHHRSVTTTSRKNDDGTVSNDRSRLLPVGRGIVSRAVLTGRAWKIDNAYEEPDFLPVIDDEEEEEATSKSKSKSKKYDGDTNDRSNERFKSMIIVPVLDGQGRPIAVIRALNKTSAGATASAVATRHPNAGTNTNDDDENELVWNGNFTNQDVQILKSLASHISVNLQSIYQNPNDEEMRLRDTIRIFKEQGIEGISSSSSSSSTTSNTHSSSSGSSMRRWGRSLFPED